MNDRMDGWNEWMNESVIVLLEMDVDARMDGWMDAYGCGKVK